MDMIETLQNMDFNIMYWVAGLFALIEFLKWAFSGFEWLFKTFGLETRSMRKKREGLERLEKTEKAIEEIKDASNRNVEMFLEHEKQVVEHIDSIKIEIVSELGKIHEKLDEHKAEIDKNHEESRATDCIILRDRLNGALRYFSQTKDENGQIHISRGDYENLEEMFQDYFKKGGNGEYRKAYKTEFQNFIIDR